MLTRSTTAGLGFLLASLAACPAASPLDGGEAAQDVGDDGAPALDATSDSVVGVGLDAPGAPDSSGDDIGQSTEPGGADTSAVDAGTDDSAEDAAGDSEDGGDGHPGQTEDASIDAGGSDAGQSNDGGGGDPGDAQSTVEPDPVQLSEPGDWPDCVTGCGNVGPATLQLQPGQPILLKGRIDGAAHAYPIGAGPDIDILAIVTPPRMLIDVRVEPTSAGSPLDPLVRTHDGGGVMTFNFTAGEGQVAAHTAVGMPYVSGLPVYVVIEHWPNFSTGSTDGGDDFTYQATVRALPLDLVDLGTLTGAGATLEADGALADYGDIVYYRFFAEKAASPTVSFTRTGSTSMVGLVSGMKSYADQLVWSGKVWDSDGDGAVVLPASYILPCTTICSDGQLEHVFAVTDWNGLAGPGSFSFHVSVSLPQ